ncbi:MAG: tetratricopeptide repeat protein [Spirochaetia bacterium]
MKKRRFLSFCGVLLTIFVIPLFPDAVEEASELFMEDKPSEAIPLLQRALEEQPQDEDLYFYLGIAYEQLEEWESAVETYERGLSLGKKRSTFLFNLGNNYSRMGEQEEAIEAYTEAIEEDEDDTPEAYLNRANLMVKTGEYPSAIEDYRTYLSLKPDTDQKENINKMVSLLSDKMRAAEERRKEEERKRREREERQQELLSDVLNSLETSSSETRNLSAGTGEVKEYEEDFDIVD